MAILTEVNSLTPKVNVTRCLSGLSSSRLLRKTHSISAEILRFPFTRAFSTRLTRGDIVLIQGVEERRGGDVVESKGGSRPNLIVSSDLVMKDMDKVILAPLSSSPARLPYEVVLPADPQTGLDKSSKIMPNQIFTVSKNDKVFVRLGTALEHMPSINKALKFCFDNLKVKDLGELKIARGDLIEIKVEDKSYEGIVVSNDVGNLRSKIAMIAHSALHQTKVTGEFEVVVHTEDTPNPRVLLVQCHTINTFAQSFLTRTGRVKENDMIKITQMLHEVLGIKD